MKKKNITLGKLNLNKSNIASFNKTYRIVGGTVGPFNTFGCPPPPTNGCPPPTGGGTQFPDCRATDGFTCGGACDATKAPNNL